MRSIATIAIVLSCLAAASAVAAPRIDDDRQAFFESRIRPLLASRCFKCHGDRKQSNHLRLDGRDALLKGGDSGPAAVPGHPEKSLIVQAVRHQNADLKMPPDKKLSDLEIADIERWIAQGAVWPSQTKPAASKSPADDLLWSFRPVCKVKPPDDPSGWSVSPVDRFIRASLQSHRLNPAPAADKRTLLRRASFDLIGLPPSPAEVDAFLADGSPRAFAGLIDQLLASPQYGERWGRHWMDVARYADTAGDNADYPVPEARLYRDYIIDSFNADKPYDQFVREQIAGDLLDDDGSNANYAQRVVATGFLALSRRYATAPYELWHLTLEDTVDTVGRAFLGMTLRCARCHDHKFDPITVRDYYALYGVFASTQFPYAGSEEFQSMKFGRRAFVPLMPAREAQPLVAVYKKDLSRLKAEIAAIEKPKPRERAAARRLDALQSRLRVLERRGAPESLPVAYSVTEGTVADANIQIHGEPAEPGERVPRGAPTFLPGFKAAPPESHASGRRQLADWIASPRNPLTVRVIVNRVWQHHFGKGIVDTPSNFGTRGGPPSHPELLDWLAAEFVEHGWSIKWLHRAIMDSKTYQLASASDPANELIDPANRFCWRFDRQRLDAEATRDAILAVSGLLDSGRAGPHPFPPIRDWTWTQHNPFKAVYSSSHRSVYLMTQRLHKHPFMALFDGPDTNTTTDVRSSSTVPLQALFLMNSDFMREAAGAFATRLCRDPPQAAGRVERAARLAFSRSASPDEKARGGSYVENYAAEAGHAGLDASSAQLEAWRSYARMILSSNEFAYVD